MGNHRCVLLLFFLLNTIDGLVIECTQEEAAFKYGCNLMRGTIEFDSNSKCSDAYKDIQEIIGTISFSSMQVDDPLQCMPRLTKISTDPSDYNHEKPLITVSNSVKGMKKFTINPKLVLYSTGKVYINIEAPDYKADVDTYRFLTSRFGFDRVKFAGGYVEDGECRMDKNVLYLSELDKCYIFKGDLVLNSKLETVETVSALHTIRGCLEIKGTKLRLKDLYFLRFVSLISCSQPPVIKDNPYLCLSYKFMKTLLDRHQNITEKYENIIKPMIKANGQYEDCSTTCTAVDIEEEDKDCQTVYGDLFLRNSILNKTQNMRVLHGRLIVDGFGQENLFNSIPKLRKIISPNRDMPAVEITRNRMLKYVEFPKELIIESQASPVIAIQRNFHYVMDKPQYVRLATKYTLRRLQIDYTNDYECYFPNPIKKLSQLDNCALIYGDLIMIGNVSGTSNTPLQLVGGCIQIIGTNLTDLSFLDNLNENSGINCTTRHEISNNKRLCPLHWVEILSETQNGKGKDRIVVFNNKDSCEHSCDRDDLFFISECVVLREGFFIPLEEPDRFLSSVVNLKEVSGSIKIKETQLSDVNVFLNLKKINVKDDEIALDITGNENLEKVDLSKLKEIESSGTSSKLIRIKKNGNYTMPYKQYKKLVEQFGEERLDIDHKDDISGYWGIILGFASAGVVAILAVVTVMTVFVVQIKKKEAKEEKEFKKRHAKGKHGNGEDSNDLLHLLKGSETKSKIADVKGIEENGGPFGGSGVQYGDGGPGGANGRSGGDVNGADCEGGEFDENGNPIGPGSKGRKGVENGVRDGDEIAGADTAVTAKSAMFGNKWKGGPRENQSVMQQEKEAMKAILRKKESGAITARTAMIGVNARYYGDLKANASVMQKHETGNMDDKKKGRNNGVSVHGPVTAKSALFNKDQKFNPVVRDNTSVVEKPAEAKSTISGAKSLTSVENGPVTARTAMLGVGKWKGGTKNNISVLDQPKTAMTAMKNWTGGTKDNASVIQGPKTAVTAMKNWKGGEKENVSVVQGPKTAMTAVPGKGGKYDIAVKDNASKMDKGAKSNSNLLTIDWDKEQGSAVKSKVSNAANGPVKPSKKK